METPAMLVLQFQPHEFAQLRWNTPGPSGKFGGYPRHENWLLANTDKTTLQCALDPAMRERTERYVGPRYGPGGPNGRLRRACIPALRRAGIDPLPEWRAPLSAALNKYADNTGEGRMRTEIMDITPAQAEEFLKHNITNRPIHKTWVRAIVGIIQRGEWKLTHQGIALARGSGDLLDGQHRLQAIVEAGVTAPMLVAFDCEPGTFTVLDAGIKRSTSDHLRIPTAEAATAIMVYRLSQATRTFTRAGGMSTAQVAPVMELFGDEIRAVCAIRGKFASSPIRAAIIAHMLEGRPVLDQFRTLNAMEFDLMEPAVQSLVRQVIDGSLIKRDLHALSARAWRAFHPDHSHNNKLTIKDLAVPLREIREVFLSAQIRREKEAPVLHLQAAE